MNPSTTTSTHTGIADSSAQAAASAVTAEKAAVAFGISAAVTVLFNTVLAWIKDAYEPLNNFMAALTGHHWWTHGLFDLIVFGVVGWVLMRRGGQDHLTDGLATGLAVAVVVAGLGLAGWFFLV